MTELIKASNVIPPDEFGVIPPVKQFIFSAKANKYYEISYGYYFHEFLDESNGNLLKLTITNNMGENLGRIEVLQNFPEDSKNQAVSYYDPVTFELFEQLVISGVSTFEAYILSGTQNLYLKDLGVNYRKDNFLTIMIESTDIPIPI